MTRPSVPCFVTLVPHCGTTLIPRHHPCSGWTRPSILWFCTVELLCFPVITHAQGGQGLVSSGSALQNHFDPLSSPMHRVDKAQHPLCYDFGSLLWNHFELPSSLMHRVDKAQCPLVPHCGTTLFPRHHPCTGLTRPCIPCVLILVPHCGTTFFLVIDHA